MPLALTVRPTENAAAAIGETAASAASPACLLAEPTRSEKKSTKYDSLNSISSPCPGFPASSNTRPAKKFSLEELNDFGSKTRENRGSLCAAAGITGCGCTVTFTFEGKP